MRVIVSRASRPRATRRRIHTCIALAVAAFLTVGMVAADATGAGAATGPNGLIAFSSWEGVDYDIYTVDPADESAIPVRLTSDGRNNDDPDWSPDGAKIAYDGWSTFGGPRIQVMDTDPATDDWTVISDPCPVDGPSCYGDFQPAWSPNGTRIAFVSSRPNADGSEGGAYEIYVMDALGEVGPLADATRLTTDVPDPEDESGFTPEDSQVTWSPDGSRIAFVSTGRGLETDSCDLWVMDSRDLDGDGYGDDLHQLTFDESFNCDAFEDVTPQWSPDSKLIAFTRALGNFDIWVVNANDPTDLRNVTRTSAQNEDQPGWSPDGTQIMFRSGESGAYEMYSLPVPAAAASTLAHAPAVRPTPTQLTFDEQTKQQADWGAVEGSAPGTVTLMVSRHGKGLVDARKIHCGRDCAGTFAARRVVTLTAVPAAGYRFKSWGGACSGTLRTCRVRLGVSKSVVARFVERH